MNGFRTLVRLANMRAMRTAVLSPNLAFAGRTVVRYPNNRNSAYISDVQVAENHGVYDYGESDEA